jgi:drug/metabolite transporter (DMT)-like permease
VEPTGAAAVEPTAVEPGGASMTAGRPSRLALLLLLFAPLLMSSNMLAARWVEGSVPPVALAFGRWFLTLVFLLPFTARALWRCRAVIGREWRTLAALGALGMGVCGAPVYLAGQTTTATNIGLIYSTTPILIVVFARLFWGERISLHQVAGISLSLVGVVVIVTRGDPGSLVHLAFTAGDMWTLLATVGWALYSVLLKYRPSKLDLIARFAVITAMGLLVMLPFLGLEMALGYVADFDRRTAATWMFLALVPGLGAYLLYGKLVAMVGPGRTGLLMYLVPIYIAGLAYVLLGEAPQLFHLIGIVMILPGIWLATAAPARER